MLKFLKNLVAGKPELTDEQLLRFFVIEEEPVGSSRYAVYFRIGQNRLLIGGPLASQGVATSYDGAQLQIMMMMGLLRRFIRELDE